MSSLQVLLAAFAFAAGLNAPASPAPNTPQVLRSGVRGAQGGEADELLRACAALHLQRKYEEALAACTKAAQLKPDEFRARVLSGYAYFGLMKLKSASESFAKAIRLRPQEKELYLLKASADTMRGARTRRCRRAGRRSNSTPATPGPTCC